MSDVTTGQVLVAMTGVPATGKSAIADAIGRHLPAPVFSVDPLEATLNRAGITRDHRSDYAAYDLAAMLTEAQIVAGQSAVVDAMNGLPHLRDWWRDIGARHGVHVVVLATTCSDRGLHRQRLEQRHRGIEGFLYDVTWARMEPRLDSYAGAPDADLVLDSVESLEANINRALERVRAVLGSGDSR